VENFGGGCRRGEARGCANETPAIKERLAAFRVRAVPRYCLTKSAGVLACHIEFFFQSCIVSLGIPAALCVSHPLSRNPRCEILTYSSPQL
jgi:hypothetical protein